MGFTNTWKEKTWNNYPQYFNKSCVWTDGENIYYSDGSDNQYVLNKSTSTWESKTWNGLTDFLGGSVWTDGDNIYTSETNGYNHYVLNKSTSTWEDKTWNRLPDSLSGQWIWTDGENIYYSRYSSNGGYQYVLNKSTSTWSTKTWNGLTNFDGYKIWTDGDNIYYSDGSKGQKILNKSTSTWEDKIWNGAGASLLYDINNMIWTDGENIYLSIGSNQYVLNKSTSTWETKTWNGLSSFTARSTWTDGSNIYTSGSNDSTFVLEKTVDKNPTPTTEFSATGTDSGTLTNAESGQKYSIDGGTNYSDIDSSSVDISSGITTTEGIKVYMPGDGETTLDSDIQEITIEQQVEPVVTLTQPTESNPKGSINTTADDEYSTDNGVTWNNCGGTLTNLEPGVYQIRTKASGSTLASEPITVIINKFQDHFQKDYLDYEGLASYDDKIKKYFNDALNQLKEKITELPNNDINDILDIIQDDEDEP